MLTLGAQLWLEGLREGRNARRQEVAEALARLAAGSGGGALDGAALFASVCRAGRVPRRTVRAALEVIEALAEDEEEEEEEEDGAAASPFRFTRALSDACRAAVASGKEGGDENDENDDDEEEEDIDAR